MSKSIVFVILSAALLFTGCRSSSDQILYTPPALSEDWSVNMIQSGGIMGMKRSITIAADSKYTILDQRTEQTVTGTLTANQTAELKQTLTTLQYTVPEIPAVCADCFVYEIEIQSNGSKMIVELDDTSLPGSGCESLVEFLRGLMESELK